MPEENSKQSQTAAKSAKRKRKKNRGEYKVVFKGRLREGYNKEQVLANIVNLTKLPEDKIDKKFFSGKAVIIRRAHDLMHAQKLQQLFFNAGLEVVILKDTEQKKHVEKNVSEEKTKKHVLKQELKKTVKTRKRPLLAIALWIVLIAIVVNLWTEFDVSVEVPDEVISIEQSLANESLVFLAHINIERLLSLQHYFVADPNAMPGVKSTLYNDLKKSGIDPQTTIQQMLMAAYMSHKEPVMHTILLGEFPVAAVKGFLIKHYHGKVIPESEFVRVQIADIDPVTCKKGNFKEVAIEADRILIATEGHLDELRRLLAKPPGSVTDMSHWADYRRDKLVSMAMFKPEKGTRLTTGLTAMMADRVIKKNKPLNSLFAGIGMQLLPPGAILDISLNSQNQSWLQKTRAELDTHIADMKSNSQGLGNLLTLLDKINIHENDAQLSVNLLMDSELKKSMTLSLQEWSDKFFSMNTSGTKDSTQPAKEKINTKPIQFKPGYAQSNLKPFNKQLDQFFKPTWSEGPFAVAIEELLLEDEQVSLQLRAKGQNIDNVGNKHAKINVIAVQNRQGKNVLARSGCSAAGQSDGDYFSLWGGLRTAYVDNKPVQFNELEVRKKVKLKPGSDFNEVTSLQARIELNLATKTRKEQFSKVQTDTNKVLSAYGSRLFFKPSASDTLSYTISGDEQRILAVRALNQNKQYLSRSSSSSMDNIWGGGRSVSQSYQGEVAFVEVVYADALAKSSYDVTINRFPPYYSDDQWVYDHEPVLITNLDVWNEKYQSLAALDMTPENNWQGELQAKWQGGPFNLALYGLSHNKHWGTSGQIHIKTPVIDELRHNLSALEVFFRYPQVADNGDTGKSYYYLLKAKGYYMNGEFIMDKNKQYMEGQLSFSLPSLSASPAQEAPIKSINGDIIVHLPLSKHSSNFSDLSIGAQWEDEGVFAKIVRMAQDVMEFEISGSRSRLLQITLYDANNKRISTSDVQQGFSSSREKHKDKIVVNYHGIPVKGEMTVSEGQQIRRYPFQLDLQ